VRARSAARERLLALGGGGQAPGGGPGGGGGPGAPAPERNVSVTARELSPTHFALQLSRPVVDGGRVGVQLRNGGEDPHNLQLAPEGSPEPPLMSFPTLAPGGVDRRFEQLDPGRYTLWCSLEGHEALGMRGVLQVR
jgi:hypothetical protein